MENRKEHQEKKRCSQAHHCLAHPDFGKELEIDNDNKYTLSP